MQRLFVVEAQSYCEQDIGPCLQEVEAGVIPAVTKVELRDEVTALTKKILEGQKASAAANKCV